jgi:hypothetical protein
MSRENRDAAINKIVAANKDSLTAYDVLNLVLASSTPIKTATLLGIDKIKQLDAHSILGRMDSKIVTNPTGLLNLIIKLFGDKIGDYEVQTLFQTAQNKEKMADTVIRLKKSKLSANNISCILRYSSDQLGAVNKIIAAKGDKLTSTDIGNIMIYSSHKGAVENSIVHVKGDKLQPQEFYTLLLYSPHRATLINRLARYFSKESLIQLAKDAGHGYNDINRLYPEPPEPSGPGKSEEPVELQENFSIYREYYKYLLR